MTSTLLVVIFSFVFNHSLLGQSVQDITTGTKNFLKDVKKFSDEVSPSQNSKISEPDTNKPSAREIIKAVEDTIGVDIEEINEESVPDIIEDATKFSNEGDLTNPNTDFNVMPKQQYAKSRLEQVKEASEKVEKLIETASEELRSKTKPVDIYGFDILQKGEIRFFNSALDVRPPDNYILGVGDELNIVVWGFADYNEVFTIDNEGYIHPRLVGRIYLKGLTLKDAKEVVRSRYSRAYNLSNSKFDMVINYSRVITVNLTGELFNSGSYTLPAINSVFNILSFVGGPTEIGTVRNIQIKRGGSIIYTFDLYKYLFKPEEQVGFYLESNDYIHVPRSEKVVEIKGEIRRPGKYELKKGEGLKDLLEFCAGTKKSAYTKSIQVKRYLNNQVYITDYDLSEIQGENGLELLDGDVVIVRKIPEILKNFVEIKGAIYVPGRYELKEGMKVSDLILEAGGLLDEVYLDEAYLVRWYEDFTKESFKLNLKNIVKDPLSPDNVVLKEKDYVEILTTTYFQDKFQISIKGAVRKPRSYDMQEGMTLRDLIILSGGLEQHAYTSRAFISRVNKFDKTISYITVALDTSNNYAALDSFKLQVNDEVEILSNLTFLNENMVSIKGTVRRPGRYELWKELSVKDLILLSGGLTENAFLERGYLFRVLDNLETEVIPFRVDTTNNMAALDNIKLQRKDNIQLFDKTTFLEGYPVEVNGVVKKPSVFDYRTNMTLADALLLAGGFKKESANNRIEIARITNFKEAIEKDIPLTIEIKIFKITSDIARDEIANSIYLEPFDQIYVRTTPGFDFQEKVYIRGEVLYPGAYSLISKDEKLSSLIRRAGGLTQYAYPKGTSMYRGGIRKGRIVMNLEMALRRPSSKFNYILKEGDSIIVPRIIDLVTVAGNIKYPYIDKDTIVNAPFTSGKRAGYYIRNYGVGFAKKSVKRNVYVELNGGHIKGTKSFLGIKFYPKVDEGAYIFVPKKEPKKPKKERTPGTGFDPFKTLDTLVGAAASGLTLYLLLLRRN